MIQSQPPAAQQPVINQTVAASPQPVATPGADPLGELGKSSQEQDDAMAWLESLAAKHGAKAEELVTDPNARTDVAPDWVDKAKTIGETPAAAPAPIVEQPPAASDDQTGMWFRDLEAKEAENVTAKTEAQEPSAVSEPSDWMSGLSDQNAFPQMSNEPSKAAEETPILNAQDTPDWLKDMQNEPAQPEKQDVPDWLRGVEQRIQTAESVAPSEAPNSDSAVDLPAWLASLDKEESTTSPATPADELPEWLASEAEPQAAEPTQPEEWHPLETESQAIEPTQPSDWSISVEPPAPVKAPSREMNFEVERPQPVKRSAPKAQKPPKPTRKSETGISVENAQAEMARGNIGVAIDVYVKLIRKGKSLEEIIRDLRDALYRYPVEVPLWQALGDAYMRSNRLQEALDAYTKAEELLR